MATTKRLEFSARGGELNLQGGDQQLDFAIAFVGAVEICEAAN